MSGDERITDPAAIRASWDDDDPEVTRIVRRVGAALNSGRDAAVVQVVLDETETMRATLANVRADVDNGLHLDSLGHRNAAIDALLAIDRALGES